MLCKISLLSKNSIILPFSYNHIIQAVLYKFINEKSFADFMHDKGYIYNNRSYKLFSFSNIIEKPTKIDKIKKVFVFPNEINIYFSSINNEFFLDVLNSIINIDEGIRLYNNNVSISKIEIMRQELTAKIIVKTLSPITAYSTIVDENNKKTTFFYNPDDDKFGSYIQNNLINKFKSYYDKAPENNDFSISIINEPRKVLIKYKNFIIKGCFGVFEILGSKELIDMAFCAGLGSKNSQGFGLIVRNDMEVN